MSRTVTTSHFRIFDYWKDKAITKDGNIVSIEECTKEDILVVEDDNEPMCWGCSKPIVGDYEKNLSKEGYKNINHEKLWNDSKVKKKLNRCHIKPNQFGGEDSPRNLFLMCGDCHVESPDTNNKEAFMRWVYRKRKNSHMGILNPFEYIRLINNELADRNLPSLEEIHRSCPNIDYSDVQQFLLNNCGLHGTSSVLSSRVVAFADYYESQIKKNF